MYSFIEYSDNYLKTSRGLWKYCRDAPINNITYFKSLKFNPKLLNNTNISGIIDAETAVLLKYLSNFVRTLEIPLKIVKLILF